MERWQAARGLTVTGLIPLGQVIFLPGAVLVGRMNVAAGEGASGGQQPYQVTTAQRTVTVPLNPNLPPASVGEAVSIVLPSQASTPGRITAVGPGQLTVTPGQPRATGTGVNVQVQVSLAVQAARGVLAVPVTALLALAGGGYGRGGGHAVRRPPPRRRDHRAVRRRPGPGQRAGHRGGHQGGGGPVNGTVSALSSTGVTKEHPGSPPVAALRSVTVTIGAGEFAAIVGPSGSGKSTMLAIAGTLERPTAGRVRVAGLAVDGLPDHALSGRPGGRGSGSCSSSSS